MLLIKIMADMEGLVFLISNADMESVISSHFEIVAVNYSLESVK